MSEASNPPHSEQPVGEAIESNVDATQDRAESAPHQTAGQVLRQAREEAGVSISNLAANLKVSAKTITALEENNVAALPDLAFSRALTSSICRTLKIPAGPILALMPSLPQAHVVTNQEAGLNLPMASPFKLNISLAWFKTSAFAIIAFLALATLAVANWPTVMTWVDQIQKMATSASSSAGLERSVTVGATSGNEVPVDAATAGSSAAVTAVAQGPAVQVAEGSASAAPSALVSAAASSAAMSTSLPAQANAAPAGSAPLVFKATASTWIEVTDMTGKPIWKKLLAANEEATVPASLPVRVLVGNAAGTSLMVNGASFNFAPFSANNIARFEVK